MSKKIRPLTAFKKANPRIYEALSTGIKATSKKGKENEWYFMFGYVEVMNLLEIDNTPPSFFWETYEKKANVGTVTELGRLLLTGWYYGGDVLRFTEDVTAYVYRAYQKTKGAFNDSKFKDAISHIRENIGYYYQEPEELKLYILKKFFNDELQPLLPDKPTELKDHNKALDLLIEIHEGRLKKDKNWYVKNYNLLDGYTAYLQEIMDSYNIEYMSREDYKAKEDKENREYWDKISQVEATYNEEIKGNAPKLIAGILPTKETE